MMHSPIRSALTTISLIGIAATNVAILCFVSSPWVWCWVVLSILGACSVYFLRTAPIQSDVPSPELKEEESTYHIRRVLDCLRAVPWVADKHSGDFTFVGPLAEDLLGFDSDAWLKPGFWSNNIHPDDRKHAIESRRRAIQRRQSTTVEYRLLGSDGTEVWVQDHVTVPPTPSGTHLIRGCMIDVSERKQLEAQIRQLETMKVVDRVASTAAHDFNNILMVVSAHAEILRQEPTVTANMEVNVDEILKAVDRANLLVKQMRGLTRQQAMQPELVNPIDLISELERTIHSVLRSKIKCRIIANQDAQVSNIGIKVDRNQFERAILNLVVNAVDAMPNGGELTVSVDCKDTPAQPLASESGKGNGRFVEIAVGDTGAGMSRRIQSRIFEPYFSTKGDKGTGLGLYGVYRFIQQSDAKIEVSSAVGKGTTIRMRFPRVELPRVVLPGQSSSDSKSVLIVDDQPLVRSIFQRMLDGPDYDVLLAGSGAEALQITDHLDQAIDLLVTDILMPKMDGIELAAAFREKHPETKVLFVTGFAEAMNRAAHLECNPMVLKKPVRAERLLAAIDDLLAK